MLVNLTQILSIAEENRYAVGAFNTPNLECINAVLSAAEKLNVPVIIAHAELHEAVSPLTKIGPVMVQAAKASRVPVCVHLDHCEDLDYMAQALEIGFTGVMYDGSTLPYEENLLPWPESMAAVLRQSSVPLPHVKAELPMYQGRYTPIRTRLSHSAEKPASMPWPRVSALLTVFTNPSRFLISIV